jgi:hypothetical protein
MTSAAVENRIWPRRHWWLLLALVFAGQLSLIFTLSDRTPLKVRPPAPAPVLQFAGNASAELLALWDPTLFALPHPQGFSAAAWIVSPPQETRAAPPPEPADFLSLPFRQLGADFNRFVATNRFDPPPPRPEPPPDLSLPNLFSQPLLPAPSAVRIEGALAQRRLLKPIVVPAWPHTDILDNSVVQIEVSADGRTISVAPIPPGSGSPTADQEALKLAREARFESVKGSGPAQAANQADPLTFGVMVFEWQTVAMPPTNAPPITPQP